MNNLLVICVATLCVCFVQARLGTRCLDDSQCVGDTECCVISSYVIKRGKCAPRLREGTRCKVNHDRSSSFWDLPYSCGCGYGTTCVEETWQDSAFPGVNLKRDRCRASAGPSSLRPTPSNPFPPTKPPALPLPTPYRATARTSTLRVCIAPTPSTTA
ncbi:hypothetical protein EB796_018295 [Bugula neritina]|uniref:Prokineticin domain-containing protein n=1 Tax=Bugula neritina TaxID=10212 RepID=A0A7J7JDC5_BUGNE|nr:hypothetical protein EB796_018295 [Bugula neritina]